ncbi:hypothetical protein F7725_029169 [Dissostichus mawsoni]|uniref:Uncharacterized protein n=1 Tax=Dissostichus mawsoni TaxID=36200 RepID=A0A7J5XI58_DISMA|nr:hypothetical protein F7725_029169 [Dissostichus mawsoni]
MESLYDLWEFYLPYLYSCISLMGGLLLLMCTPVGLSRMFSIMGQLLVKPTILEDLDEQIYCIHLQEEALQRRLNVLMVVFNILYLLVDETAMPKGSTAVLEIILMFLRVFQSLTPRNDDTTMTTIIGCCVSILVLSSALPVMSRTLGITRFDLLETSGDLTGWETSTSCFHTTCCLDKLQLSNSPTDPESGKLSANGHQKTL